MFSSAASRKALAGTDVAKPEDDVIRADCDARGEKRKHRDEREFEFNTRKIFARIWIFIAREFQGESSAVEGAPNSGG